jgi:hypothetical protein
VSREYTLTRCPRGSDPTSNADGPEGTELFKGILRRGPLLYARVSAIVVISWGASCTELGEWVSRYWRTHKATPRTSCRLLSQFFRLLAPRCRFGRTA